MFKEVVAPFFTMLVEEFTVNVIAAKLRVKALILVELTSRSTTAPSIAGCIRPQNAPVNA